MSHSSGSWVIQERLLSLAILRWKNKTNAHKLGEIRPLLVLGPDGVNLQLLEDVRVEGEALNLATDLL